MFETSFGPYYLIHQSKKQSGWRSHAVAQGEGDSYFVLRLTGPQNGVEKDRK